MISYKPFLKWMIDNDIDKSVLHDKLTLSWTTISKLSKGEPVRMDILEKICLHFNIPIEQVVEIKKDPSD